MKIIFFVKEDVCLEVCPFNPGVKIGSGGCAQCDQHINHSSEKEEVHCKMERLEKLKRILK